MQCFVIVFRSRDIKVHVLSADLRMRKFIIVRVCTSDYKDTARKYFCLIYINFKIKILNGNSPFFNKLLTTGHGDY